MKEKNEVEITGRLGADPSFHETQKGNTLARLRFCIYPKGNAGWMSATVFDDEAVEECEDLQEGDDVLIKGRINISSYENRNGDTVWTTALIASSVERVELEIEDSEPPKQEKSKKASRKRVEENEDFDW